VLSQCYGNALGVNSPIFANDPQGIGEDGAVSSKVLVVGLMERAVEVQGDFNPTNVAMTLWAFATLGQQPREELVKRLTMRVVELQDDLNFKNIANTLWAHSEK